MREKREVTLENGFLLVAFLLLGSCYVVGDMNSGPAEGRVVKPTCWRVEGGPKLCAVELPDGGVCYWTPSSYASMSCERKEEP